VKVFGQKMVPTKMFVVPKGVRVASLKNVLAKATHAKPMPKASVAPGSSVLLKAVAPSMTGVSKTVVIVSASREGVLRIYTENKGRLQLRLPQCKGNKRGLMLGLLRPPPPLIKFWCDHKLR
jgi:hypothetical protein